jgi:flagellin
MATINGTAGLGITASISNAGATQKLVLTSSTTGSANTIAIDTGTSTAGALTALGYTGSETDVAGTNAVNDTLVLNVDGVNKNVIIQAGDTTLTSVVNDINNTTLNPGIGVTASISGSGATQKLVLTSAGTPGSTDNVTVVTAGTTPELLTGTPLGFAGGEIASGTGGGTEDNLLNIAVGSNSPVTVTLASGTYTAAQMVAQLNTQLSADSVAARASLDSAGHLVLTANQPGQSLTLNAVTGSAYSTLGLTAGTSTSAMLTSSDNIQVRISGGGMSSPVTLALNPTVAGATSVASVLADLTSKVAGNPALANAGIALTSNTDGNNLVFTDSKGETFQVAVTGDTNNVLGFGSFQAGAGGAFDYSTITGTAPLATTAAAATLNVSVNGGATTQISVPSASTPAATLVAINSQITTTPALHAAGLIASLDPSTGALVLTSSNGTNFRVSGGGADLGFGISGGAYAGATVSAAPVAGRVDSTGAYTSSVMDFTPMTSGSDSQTISVTATDANGATHSLAIPLQNNSTAQTGDTIDDAIHAINTQLQQSNDSTLQSIYAVKEDNADGTESIKFMSTTQNFKVAVSSLSDGSGITPPAGGISTATQNGTGADVSIDTISGAESAVNALATAVQKLGTAQAAVGKGENLLNYATNLAQSQLTDEASSESQIRDANLAQEAANLTKAQILMQAGTAALAQANSAPQQLLSLLQQH